MKTSVFFSAIISLLFLSSISYGQGVSLYVYSQPSQWIPCYQPCISATLTAPPGSYTIEWNWNDGSITTQQVNLTGNSITKTACHTYDKNASNGAPKIIVSIYSNTGNLLIKDSIQVLLDCTFKSNIYTFAEPFIKSCSSICMGIYYTHNASIGSTIDITYLWGDGQSTNKTINNVSGTIFDSTACHSYTTPGIYTIKILLSYANNVIDSALLNVIIPDTCGTIYGLVFEDKNGNCSYDTGEPLINNAYLILKQGTTTIKTTFSQTNGKYNFDFLTASNYSVEFGHRQGYSVATGCPTIHNNATINSSTSYDFALSCNPTANNKDSVIALLSPPVPNFNSNFTITICNNSCNPKQTNVNVIIPPKIKYMSHIISNSNNYTYSQNNDTLHFSIDIPPVSCSNINITFWNDTTLLVGDTICITYNINSSNYYTCEEVLGSWDPNDKQVYPKGTIPPGTPLTYKIRFQNTGTAPAYRVIIRDTLNENLDPTSIYILDHSHPMNFSINNIPNSNKNVITFNFHNIYLPDSSTDPQGSQGFILFKIAPKTNLPLGTQIDNKAAIYFDFNPPVITNTVSIIYDNTTAIKYNNNSIKIYPNPATNFIKVENLSQTSQYKITSIEGKEIKSGILTPGTNIINLTTISSGTYILTIDNKHYKITIIK